MRMIAIVNRNKQEDTVCVSPASGFLLKSHWMLLISYFKVLQLQAHLVSAYDKIRQGRPPARLGLRVRCVAIGWQVKVSVMAC